MRGDLDGDDETVVDAVLAGIERVDPQVVEQVIAAVELIDPAVADRVLAAIEAGDLPAFAVEDDPAPSAPRQQESRPSGHPSKSEPRGGKR